MHDDVIKLKIDTACRVKQRTMTYSNFAIFIRRKKKKIYLDRLYERTENFTFSLFAFCSTEFSAI